MAIETLDCLSCDGKGEFYYICKNRMMQCLPCKGTGKVERDPQWAVDGGAFRRARIAAKKSLREAAKEAGVTAVQLSAFERGTAPLPEPPRG